MFEKKKYRESCTKNEKRCIPRKAQKIDIDDGELLCIKNDITKVFIQLQWITVVYVAVCVYMHPRPGFEACMQYNTIHQ